MPGMRGPMAPGAGRTRNENTMLKRIVERMDEATSALALAACGLLAMEASGLYPNLAGVFRAAGLCILALFGVNVVWDLATAERRGAHVRRHWFAWLVFAPLIQFAAGIEGRTAAIVLSLLAIGAMLVSRVRRTNRFAFLLSLKPAFLMLVSFAAAILAGTVLLMLPAASASAGHTSLIDALFTATSAACVTGLTVQDTATHFSLFGQCVILALIQAGGLGIMTFSVAIVLLMRRTVGVSREATMRAVLDQEAAGNIRRLILFICGMTFATELLGTLALTIVWWGRFPPADTVYHAAFQSISAFCNAGFSTWSDNLVQFSGDWVTCGIIAGLIVVGGLGFVVIHDVWEHTRRRLTTGHRWARPYRAQTQIALRMTLALILGGALLIGALEWSGAFAGRPPGERALLALFQSITTRTAGFNTADIAALGPATLLVMMALMFIGACPGSTAGGIKTTTLAVVLAAARRGLQRRSDVEMCRRTVPGETVQKAIAVVVLSAAAIFAVAIALLANEELPFEKVLFEAVSAFGTVGLSAGITGSLTVWGKAWVSLLMFIGRLGPLTVAFAFLKPGKPANYRHAEEQIMIG